jgi:hypothetical protein
MINPNHRMNKLILLSLTLIGVFQAIEGMAQRYGNIPKTAASSPCGDFQKKHCNHSLDEGFAYNGQSRSGLFSKGQHSTVRVVFFKGMDYHIAICTEDDSPANFIIKDAKTGQILYDNAADNNTQEIQISNENTRNVNILVTLPGADQTEKKDIVKGAEGMCAGLLIEHRRSDKTGF